MSGALFFKMLLSAWIAVVCSQLIRGKTPGIALLVSVSALAVLLGLLLPHLQSIRQQMQGFLMEIGLENDLFLPIVKVIGITQLTHLSAELCRDAGERAIAAKLELCGAVASLMCVLPLAQRALSLVGALGS